MALLENLTQLQLLRVEAEWSELLDTKRRELEAALPQFFVTQRWFGQKGRSISGTNLSSVLPIGKFEEECFLTIVDVHFSDGAKEQYLLPLSLVPHQENESATVRQSKDTIGTVTRSDGRVLGVLHDAVYDRKFVGTLLRLVGTNAELTHENVRLFADDYATRVLPFTPPNEDEIDIKPLGVQQSNSSLRVGEQLIIKVIRRVEEGENPEVEIGRHLTHTVGFVHSPPTLAAITLQQKNCHHRVTVAILQNYIVNDGDAWAFFQREIASFFRKTLFESLPLLIQPTMIELLSGLYQPLRPHLYELIGPVLDAAQLLGKRTAELHMAFANSTTAAFVQEPFSTEYRLQLHQSFLFSASRCLQSLNAYRDHLTGNTHEKAKKLLAREAKIFAVFEAVRKNKIEATRIRIHGDYHLGQVLRCRDDFIIIDFEGEPTRSIGERTLKHSPLRDVAGMLRSFDYAAMSAVSCFEPGPSATNFTVSQLRPWAEQWSTCISTKFLEGYLRTSGSAAYLPKNQGQLMTLLGVFLLEKALYEIEYEIGHRPDWIHIPIEAALRLLDSESGE